LGKIDSMKINELHHLGRPENPLRLIRNQQVAGSIPAGGSNSPTTYKSLHGD